MTVRSLPPALHAAPAAPEHGTSLAPVAVAAVLLVLAAILGAVIAARR